MKITSPLLLFTKNLLPPVQWLTVMLLITPDHASGQQINAGADKWTEYIEELLENSEEDDAAIETLYDDLSNLAGNPLNLNIASAEELKKIPFLSDMQIMQILNYRQKQEQFVSIYELKNIRFLDMPAIERILPFVYVGEISNLRSFNLKNLLKYGKNELMMRYDRCLNEKKGYGYYPDSILVKYPNRKYVGEPFYSSVRYAYSFDNRLQMGFVAEKDAGEAFWNDRHKGFDYYSAHLFLKELGKIRSLAVGDFKASFGQGLVVSNDFTPSRSSILSQAERRTNGFRRHYSTSENNFFRGAAATLSLKKFDVSAFYSIRPADATMTGGEDAVSSFKTDGLHRTEGDLEKKHRVNMHTAGGNICYISPQLLVGMTALTYSFGGLSVDPDPRPYNAFYFRGRRNSNISLDYKWQRAGIAVYGETALSQNGAAAATLNAFRWSASSDLQALILYRYYDRNYQAFHGNAFSQGATVQNEEGLYLSMEWEPAAYWKLSGYADFFRFPWMKYAIDAPSSGKEYMLQADFDRIENTILSVRYRFRQREKNFTEAREAIIKPVDRHRLRLQITHTPSDVMTCRTTVEGNIYDENVSDVSRGWMISQSAGWGNTDSPVNINVYAAWFHTTDYNSRIYSAEKHLPYSFVMPAFYGHGTRLSTVVRYYLTPMLYLSVKAALTYYFDRRTIGSGTEEIEGEDKTDLSVLLRWKF
jgi:hypothetical protein